MTNYQPLACHLYDLLEIYTLRRLPTRVRYTTEEGREICVEEVRLKDLQTIRGEEFLWLDNGSKPIRLDRLISVGNETFLGSCKI